MHPEGHDDVRGLDSASITAAERVKQQSRKVGFWLTPEVLLTSSLKNKIAW